MFAWYDENIAFPEFNSIILKTDQYIVRPESFDGLKMCVYCVIAVFCFGRVCFVVFKIIAHEHYIV